VSAGEIIAIIVGAVVAVNAVLIAGPILGDWWRR
jgi:hypothetical protein